MSTILGIFMLSCLPSLIVALVVRHQAHRRTRQRHERAWLVAITVGSPGVYPVTNGVVVGGLIVPSLFAAFTASSIPGCGSCL